MRCSTWQACQETTHSSFVRFTNTGMRLAAVNMTPDVSNTSNRVHGLAQTVVARGLDPATKKTSRLKPSSQRKRHRGKNRDEQQDEQHYSNVGQGAGKNAFYRHLRVIERRFDREH